mmetsp:Transcript_96600/g.216349  ORF Transcript_96600/g.216349 Transcript_96600/m.216349 type:complete len:342 (+) Transcript_96600:55-1080(+)
MAATCSAFAAVAASAAGFLRGWRAMQVPGLDAVRPAALRSNHRGSALRGVASVESGARLPPQGLGLGLGLGLTLGLAARVASGACAIVGLRRPGRGGARAALSTAAVASRASAPAVRARGPFVAFVIGGPGSGKGTQCERIAEEFGYIHLSAGDLLRAERQREGSPLGEVIEATIRAGKVVPSEMIAELLEQAMREAGWDKAKFVIDGYPRSAEQLAGWESTLNKRVHFLFCLYLEVGREEMLQRLLGRAKSSGRSDDNVATIEKRFVTFEEETGPLLEHFDSKGTLRRIDGGRALEAVWTDVRGLFEEEEAKVAEGRSDRAGSAAGGTDGGLKALLLGGL